MRLRRLLASTLLAMCSTAVSLYAVEDPNEAGVEDPNMFGMMGGGLGEVLRVNAAVDAGAVAPGPCAVALGFADAAGEPIGRPVNIDLMPGQSAFVEFDFGAVVSRLGQRFEARPVITPVSDGSAAACGLSAEIYDRFTGRTSSYVQPVPPGRLAPIGVAPGQVLRLNLVAVPPGPCRAVMSFAGADGAAAGSSFSADLLPGHAAFLDLPMSGPLRPFGTRAEIRPVVLADPAAASCVASAEVWEQFTGRNAVYARAPVTIGQRPQ